MGNAGTLVAFVLCAGCSAAPTPVVRTAKPHVVVQPTHEEYLATSRANAGWATAVAPVQKFGPVDEYARFVQIFGAQDLLSLAKKAAPSVADYVDTLVEDEEGPLVKLARDLRKKLTGNEFIPIEERQFLANVEFDEAIEALRARVEKRLCPILAFRLVETPKVIIALRSAFVAYAKMYGVPNVNYEPEIEHGQRFLMTHCKELAPAVDLDAGIQRRRGVWVAIVKGKRD